MEEKERYIIDRFDEDIFDTKKEYYPSNQTICEIINKQDKRIKELEETNKELEIKLDKCVTELVNAENLVSYLENENQQLKQQLHDLPKKIVEEIRKWGQKHYNWVGDGTGYDGQDYNECIGFNMAIDQLNEILDTILKKYGGEDE